VCLRERLKDHKEGFPPFPRELGCAPGSPHPTPAGPTPNHNPEDFPRNVGSILGQQSGNPDPREFTTVFLAQSLQITNWLRQMTKRASGSLKRIRVFLGHYEIIVQHQPWFKLITTLGYG